MDDIEDVELETAMITRNDSTREAGKQQLPDSYESEFFSLPSLHTSSDEYLLHVINTALSSYHAKFKHDADTVKMKSAIALDLVNLARILPPNRCLNILIEASRHTLFTNTPAHQIITSAITRETLYRSPMIVSEHTLGSVMLHKQNHPMDVDNFLKHPELLLIWINHAPALETSRLLKHFYQRDSRYYLHMLAAAKQEIAAGQPAKAVLCMALMNVNRPAAEDISNIEKAITWLAAIEPAGSYENIFTSLQVYLYPTIDNLNKAGGRYINANSLELCGVKFIAHDFRGARLKHAKLDCQSLTNINFTGACLDNAALSGTDLTGTNLTDASLVNANLSFSLLANTNLNGADFSSADLSYADLTRANLKNAKFDNANFDSSEFMSSSNFHDPLAFEAELDRLQDILTQHRNETRLRTAIIWNIIQFTRKSAIDTATAITILKAAHAHPISKQHQPIQVLKASADFVVNYAQAACKNLFFKTALPPLPVIETDEAKLLRLEYEKQEAQHAAAHPASTPAAITSAPHPN